MSKSSRKSPARTAIMPDIPLSLLMPSDRLRFIRRIKRLQHQSAEPAAVELAQLDADIAAARARRETRQQQRPVPGYDPVLPIVAKRDEILTALQQHSVIIVCGETGSGKSTQLPKFCLEAGRGVDGYIGHTQPRRLAARSIAERVAQELQSSPGQHVGFKIRFTDQTAPHSYIKVMTDGILLAESRTDRLLLQYDTLIIDEAHERSLNIDFLLGYLKQLLPRRPDLKLIITSATIDPGHFSRFFNDAPVIEVSGRSYPVEIRYRPLQSQDDAAVTDMPSAVTQAIDELQQDGRGDVLVFLPGERDIRDTAEALRKHHPPECEILPLYARLGVAEQHRIFAPHSGTRIVLATNVAETSLTVPGIRYVVDSGLARLSRYSHRSKIQRLPIEKISQASARQRAGRCGRVSAGICIRLYDENDHDSRPAFTEPEIQRTNLANVILQLHNLQLGHIDKFDFPDRPDPRLIRDGYRLLEEIGAIVDNHLTRIGKQLAHLPLDPRYGRILLAAQHYQCLTEALIIVSALSVQDPRERPPDKQQRAREQQAQFNDSKSDFLTLLNLWNFYHAQRQHLSRSKLRKLCAELFLSARRMEEWRDIHQQLHGQLREQGAKFNQQPAGYDAVHKALLSGLATQIGMRTDTADYEGPRGIKFRIFPGSTLGSSKPKWVMAGALIETSQLYAHQVAVIAPEWVEEVAPALIKHHEYDPHWQAATAQVGGYERTSLFGLLLCNKRRINFGARDPVTARTIFIREALVHGQLNTRAPFLAHNRDLTESIRQLEQKTRRPDILVDEAVIYDFYDQQLPATIHSGPHFERWYREAARHTPRLLFLSEQDVMQHAAEQAGARQFPDALVCNSWRIPLQYHFAPGADDDGVTAQVPLTALAALEEAPFSWLVPGLRQEKLVALIKALPKAVRKHCIPAPEYARACLDALPVTDKQAFTVAAARQLQRMTGVTITPEQWDERTLPAHLQMRFVIVDDNGKSLGDGRNLAELKTRLAGKTQQTFDSQLRWPLPEGSFSDWPMEELPKELQQLHHGQTLRGYPAFEAGATGVAIRVFPDQARAAVAMRAGLQQLFELHLARELKYLRKNLPQLTHTCLCLASTVDCATLTDDILAATIERVFLAHADLDLYQRRNYQTALEAGRRELVAAANRLAEDVHRLALAWQQSQLLLEKVPVEAIRADIRVQLEHLVYPGFIKNTPLPWRDHLPRYLKAVKLRLDKALDDNRRDQQKMAELTPHWQRWAQLAASPQHRSNTELQTYYWMLQEFRVMLFAQELKTAIKISAQRLEQQWQQVSART